MSALFVHLVFGIAQIKKFLLVKLRRHIVSCRSVYDVCDCQEDLLNIIWHENIRNPLPFELRYIWGGVQSIVRWLSKKRWWT